ncbi:MAG: hypothetical protein MJ160_00950 [Treponema sp.]|nr:hypothetical protein [Treponema sp.]
MKKIKKYFTGVIFFTPLLLIIGCNKTNSADTSFINSQSEESKVVEIIPTEVVSEENTVTKVFERDINKNKNGISEISKICSEYQVELVPSETLCVPEIIAKPFICDTASAFEGAKFYMPYGPCINEDGELSFYYKENTPEIEYIYKNRKWSIDEKTDSNINLGKIIYNQNGRSLDSNFNYRYKGHWYDLKEFLPDHYDSSLIYVYDVNDGAIIQNSVTMELIGVNFANKTVSNPIPADELNNWLEYQEGKFTVEYKNEGWILYKDEIQYSLGYSYINVLAEYPEASYYGKLKTGHNIFFCKNKILISDNTGEILEEIIIPWHFYSKNSSKSLKFNLDSFSFGNYGEMYCLIGPASNNLNKNEYDYYDSELVVIKNYFEKFGLTDALSLPLFNEAMDDAKVNCFITEPTGFYFLDDVVNEENPIDPKKWYRVRLIDGTEGYFFGDSIKSLSTSYKSKYPIPNTK